MDKTQHTHDRESESMPNKGTSAGVTDTYGADVSAGATNRAGSIRGAMASDPVHQDKPPGDRATHRNPGEVNTIGEDA